MQGDKVAVGTAVDYGYFRFFQVRLGASRWWRGGAGPLAPLGQSWAKALAPGQTAPGPEEAWPLRASCPCALGGQVAERRRAPAQCPCGAGRGVWPPGGGAGCPGRSSDPEVLQDRKIAHCPFHTLTPAERETFLARKRLLDYMGFQLRRAVLARESQWDPKLLCLSKRGGGGAAPEGRGRGEGAGASGKGAGPSGKGRGRGRDHPGRLGEVGIRPIRTQSQCPPHVPW